MGPREVGGSGMTMTSEEVQLLVGLSTTIIIAKHREVGVGDNIESVATIVAGIDMSLIRTGAIVSDAIMTAAVQGNDGTSRKCLVSTQFATALIERMLVSYDQWCMCS